MLYKGAGQRSADAIGHQSQASRGKAACTFAAIRYELNILAHLARITLHSRLCFL